MVSEDGPADVHGVGALADDERVLWDDVVKRGEYGVVVERHGHVVRHFVGGQFVLAALVGEHCKYKCYSVSTKVMQFKFGLIFAPLAQTKNLIRSFDFPLPQMKMY